MGGNPRHNEDVARAVQNFINTFDLVHIWQEIHIYVSILGGKKKNPLIQSRLDLWLVPNSMQDAVKNTGISPAHLDNVQNKTRGPSYWKFNNSL